MSSKMPRKIDNRGVTLVEVMISLVILLIVFMGLIQASLLSINHNLRNEIRDEAVMLAAEYMTRTRSAAFSNLPRNDGFSPWPATPAVNPYVVTRNFRNISRPFQVQRQIIDLDSNTKKIGIMVLWTYPDDPGNQLSHTIYFTMTNQVQE